MLAVNMHDEVFYYDPQTGERGTWPPPREEYHFGNYNVGYLDAGGIALRPYGEYTQAIRHILDGVSAPSPTDTERLQLADDPTAVDAAFASAMDRGVAPGSDDANELAERHFAVKRLHEPMYSYELHRSDARLLVTDATLRNPYEETAPGLARYVRDVILANAERHLDRPDDPGP